MREIRHTRSRRSVEAWPFSAILRMQSMPEETLHDDATTAFLFQCGKSDLFAVSHDRTGTNIPTGECPEGWLLQHTFRLGVREPVPASDRAGANLERYRGERVLHLARRSDARDIAVAYLTEHRFSRCEH